NNVSFETAVRLTAEMAGLKMVALGNVLFVTTEANAAKLQADTNKPLQAPGIGSLGIQGGGLGLGILGGALGLGGGALGFGGGFPASGSPKLITLPRAPTGEEKKADAKPKKEDKPSTSGAEAAAKRETAASRLRSSLSKVVSLKPIAKDTPL